MKANNKSLSTNRSSKNQKQFCKHDLKIMKSHNSFKKIQKESNHLPLSNTTHLIAEKQQNYRLPQRSQQIVKFSPSQNLPSLGSQSRQYLQSSYYSKRDNIERQYDNESIYHKLRMGSSNKQKIFDTQESNEKYCYNQSNKSNRQSNRHQNDNKSAKYKYSQQIKSNNYINDNDNGHDNNPSNANEYGNSNGIDINNCYSNNNLKSIKRCSHKQSKSKQYNFSKNKISQHQHQHQQHQHQHQQHPHHQQLINHINSSKNDYYQSPLSSNDTRLKQILKEQINNKLNRVCERIDNLSKSKQKPNSYSINSHNSSSFNKNNQNFNSIHFNANNSLQQFNNSLKPNKNCLSNKQNNYYSMNIKNNIKSNNNIKNSQNHKNAEMQYGKFYLIQNYANAYSHSNEQINSINQNKYTNNSNSKSNESKNSKLCYSNLVYQSKSGMAYNVNNDNNNINTSTNSSHQQSQRYSRYQHHVQQQKNRCLQNGYIIASKQAIDNVKSQENQQNFNTNSHNLFLQSHIIELDKKFYLANLKVSKLEEQLLKQKQQIIKKQKQWLLKQNSLLKALQQANQFYNNYQQQQQQIQSQQNQNINQIYRNSRNKQVRNSSALKHSAKSNLNQLFENVVVISNEFQQQAAQKDKLIQKDQQIRKDQLIKDDKSPVKNQSNNHQKGQCQGFCTLNQHNQKLLNFYKNLAQSTSINLHEALKKLQNILQFTKNWTNLMNRTLSEELPGTAFRVKQQMNLNSQWIDQSRQFCTKFQTSINPSLSQAIKSPSQSNVFNTFKNNESQVFLLQSYCPPSSTYEIQTKRQRTSNLKRSSFKNLSVSECKSTTNKKYRNSSTQKKPTNYKKRLLQQQIPKNEMNTVECSQRKSQFYCDQVFYNKPLLEKKDTGKQMKNENFLKDTQAIKCHSSTKQASFDFDGRASDYYLMLQIQALTIQSLMVKANLQKSKTQKAFEYIEQPKNQQLQEQENQSRLLDNQ